MPSFGQLLRADQGQNRGTRRREHGQYQMGLRVRKVVGALVVNYVALGSKRASPALTTRGGCPSSSKRISPSATKPKIGPG